MPVVLLCHCDGTNGSTTFTDASPIGRPLSAAGQAVVSTAQVKFGTGSASFVGVAASAIRTASGAANSDFDFLSAPFTIEAWAYASSLPAVQGIVAQFNNASGGGWFFGSVSSGVLAFWYWDGAGAQQQFNSATTIPTGAWHFYTADRDAGGTLRLYIDGVVVASRSAPTFQSSTTQLNIGNTNRGIDNWTVGYIDEVRITNGAALYAGAFTPPTGPFGGVAAPIVQARAMVLA